MLNTVILIYLRLGHIENSILYLLSRSIEQAILLTQNAYRSHGALDVAITRRSSKPRGANVGKVYTDLTRSRPSCSIILVDSMSWFESVRRVVIAFTFRVLEGVTLRRVRQHLSSDDPLFWSVALHYCMRRRLMNSSCMQKTPP